MPPLAILTVAMLLVLAGVLWARLHPFLVLIVTALVVAGLTPPDRLGDAAALPIGRRVAEGFGKTAHDIGILIAMASILGQCLMEARGAERIVAAIERVVGRRRAALAFLGAGFLLGIPMFAEGVFYLLLPLAKASWRETRRHGVLLVLSIVAGATMTHSLVPPTPGPLFVADEMGIDIALMMRQGMIVGAVAALAGFGYATWADRHFDIPLRTAEDDRPGTVPDDERPGTAIGPLPPLWASLLPILLPVVLISADSAVDSIAAIPPTVARVIHVVGDKNLALTVSAFAAILLLACRPRSSRENVRQAVAAAVLEGGEIILVIAAGGALGATLRQAGMAELAAAAVPQHALLLLPIAWGVTVLIRAAQGSATVAMITAVGIIAPIADAASLPYHEVYVALAIGCGSKPGMWMNDSGFWVIARMTGMTETETLKTASVMVAIEGTVGLLATMALAASWPLN
ncbi:MAG: GntP family permease [Planctomycetota bacterium]|nr:MAG: GntP family permease [Planctomycetota bacterium]